MMDVGPRPMVDMHLRRASLPPHRRRLYAPTLISSPLSIRVLVRLVTSLGTLPLPMASAEGAKAAGSAAASSHSSSIHPPLTPVWGSAHPPPWFLKLFGSDSAL